MKFSENVYLHNYIDTRKKNDISVSVKLLGTRSRHVSFERDFQGDGKYRRKITVPGAIKIEPAMFYIHGIIRRSRVLNRKRSSSMTQRHVLDFDFPDTMILRLVLSNPRDSYAVGAYLVIRCLRTLLIHARMYLMHLCKSRGSFA